MSLHPRETKTLFGHEELFEQLMKQFQNERLHHAHILVGPKGVGRATFAYNFARHILNVSTHDDAMRVERQVAAGSHPNLIAIERAFDEKKGKYKRDITVEQMEKLQPFIRQTSADGGWRFIIIDPADHMNRSVQNGVLKALEEPPEKTIFFLIAENSSLLLPTIRSRCISHGLKPLSYNDLKEALEQNFEVRDQLTNSILWLAQGCYGRALQLIDDQADVILDDFLQALSNLLGDNQKDLMAFCDNYSSSANDEAYQTLRFIVGHFWQTVIKRTIGQITPQHNKVLSQLIDDELDNVINELNAKQLIQIYDQTSKKFDQGNQSYLDRSLILLQILNIFKETALSQKAASAA